MLTPDTYLTILSALSALHAEFQRLLRRECRKFFFRNDVEIARLRVALEQIERAQDELLSIGRAAA